MGTQVFLGKPPASIEQWIKDHHGPVVKLETYIKFVDGTEGNYLIEGAMDCPALIAAGLMPPGSGTEQEPSWIKQPLEANVGSAVTSIEDGVFYNCNELMIATIPNSITSIGNSTFFNCYNLTSVIIPNSVTSIGGWVFTGCELMSVTFSGKTMATVRAMSYYSWDLPSGCVLHCTDGNIIIQ